MYVVSMLPNDNDEACFRSGEYMEHRCNHRYVVSLFRVSECKGRLGGRGKRKRKKDPTKTYPNEHTAVPTKNSACM